MEILTTLSEKYKSLCKEIKLLQTRLTLLEWQRISTETPSLPKILTNPCDDCWFTKRLQTGEIYIGDSPGIWCQHSPYKVTCTSVSTKINQNKSQNKSEKIIKE